MTLINARRREVGLSLGAWMACAAAASGKNRDGAPVSPSPSPAAPGVLTMASDGLARMTAPVRINGHGPFAFVIDTGADRTVISRELASALDLPAGPSAAVHGTGGVGLVGTALIAEFQVGPQRLRDLQAPMLAQADLGAAGMIGIDCLRENRVVMDFRTGRMRVEASTPEPFDPRAIVVTARPRYGQLILMDADARGVPILVILDSGAQNTVGNSVLRQRLEARDPMQAISTRIEVLSVTGQTTDGEMSMAPVVRIGGFTLHNLTLAFAELSTFSDFDLTRFPAMLLGMDVLRKFDRVTVDFGRKEARFNLPGDG